MIKFYKTIDGRIAPIEQFENGCWVNLTCPTEEEIAQCVEKTGANAQFIKAPLDDEETSRIDKEDDATLIVIDVPISQKDEEDRHTITTMPLGVIIAKNSVITVALKECSVISDFENKIIKDIETSQKTRFLLMVILRAANRYLFYLRQIEKTSEVIENTLYKSQKNKEFIQLLILQKSLVFFSTSLKGTEGTLEKLLRGRIIKLYEEDQDLLEDVIIEFKQAIEMSDIYSNILTGTMDAFGSVVSNNLNINMKILTLITIFMTIPTVVFSYYGMNVPHLPLADEYYPIIISLVAVAIIWAIMKKRKLY